MNQLPDNQNQQTSLGFSDSHDVSQKLPKVRKDLEITPQVYYGKPCHVVKDPTTLRYYRLRPAEYLIFMMLNGTNEVDDILGALKGRFPEEEYNQGIVLNFILMMRQAGLLNLSAGSDTDFLLKRKEKMNRSLFKRIRSEYLFFKIPLFDPDNILNSLHNGLGKVIFNPMLGLLTIGMLVVAFFMFINNLDKIGDAQPILSWINLIYFVPCFFMIKWIHEFAHGLTSKHYGNEVHEMGFLFLVFNPALYCDVSDAWMIPEKSKRMWITAAGIVVEVVLAGVATFIWAFTESGSSINQFFFNMMVITSVSTILFNANPLLRYDGYYFLMDLVEIPNLRQKSTQYIFYLMKRYILGVKTATMPIDVDGRKGLVLTYAIMAMLYRWFIMVAIIYLVWTFFDNIGFGVVGGIMAISAIFTSFISPLIKAGKYIKKDWDSLEVHVGTAIGFSIFVIGFFGFGLLFPVNQEVNAQCLLRPKTFNVMYVNQPGFFYSEQNQDLLIDGQAVSPGQTLMVLTDETLSYEVTSLQLEISQAVLRKEVALHNGNDKQRKIIEYELDILHARYDQAKTFNDKLIIKAQDDAGVGISGHLQLRTGMPLKDMLGTYMSLHSPLFSIYKKGHYEAVVAVSKHEHGFIQANQRAKIKLWSCDGIVFEGITEGKAASSVQKMSSPVFSSMLGGEVATLPSASFEDALTPAEPTYEVVIQIASDQIESTAGKLQDGLVGRASIIVDESQTVGGLVFRWLVKTFPDLNELFI